MLHVVVNTHEATDCPLRSTANRESTVPALRGIDAAAAAAGATVEGAWINPAGHLIFLLVEAQNAHAVDEMVRSAGLAGRTTTRTYPVLPLRTLLDSLEPAPPGADPAQA